MTQRLSGKKPDASLRGLSIAFDLDGTLVDTAPDLMRITNEVIALEGLPPTDYEKARAVVGFGSRRLLTDAFAREGRSVSADRLEELQIQFLLKYAATIADHSKPYSGVVSTLKNLTDRGAELSVCTNKPGWLARPLLNELNLSRYFSRVVGGDEARKSKPDPSHIFAAAGHRDGSRIVMVGDSYPDMGAAHNAGATAILVTYGYSPVPPKRLKADIRLRHFRDLTSAL